MTGWEDVVAFCRTLPDVKMESYYGPPCPKLNGKPLCAPSREADSFCLMVTKAEKEILLETDPDHFWQTDHYRNYPAILVRYGAPFDRVELYLWRRWWDLAKKAQRCAASQTERP
ncbi:MAG: hypothetical protein CMN73_13895 [Sphingomonas sp.]|nr:hypothetical protein [Sphingomonas sp.]|tara:strand:- start:96 stop:440 length:345 start_codon:yes stop_codon:yes gene_type:complete